MDEITVLPPYLKRCESGDELRKCFHEILNKYRLSPNNTSTRDLMRDDINVLMKMNDIYSLAFEILGKDDNINFYVPEYAPMKDKLVMLYLLENFK